VVDGGVRKNVPVTGTQRALYSASTETFCRTSAEEILGTIASGFPFPVEIAQRNAWWQEIVIF
jgi:hypothetical protein